MLCYIMPHIIGVIGPESDERGVQDVQRQPVPVRDRQRYLAYQ